MMTLINHIADNTPTLQGRLYPNVVPQGSTMPSAVFTVINSRDYQGTTTGLAHKNIKRFQVDVYASTYKEIQQITTEIKSALYSFITKPFAISTQDAYSGEEELFRQIIEFKFKD